MEGQKAYLAGGHVYCRLRKQDLAVETCFGCTRLREINDKASPPYILCDSTDFPEMLAGDASFVEWWYQHHRRAR